MSEVDKEALESFVTSALRSRLEESAKAVIELRQQLGSSLERVESAIQIAGEKTLSIPDDLLPLPAPAEGADATLGHIHRAQTEMLSATEQVGLLTQLLLSCAVSCPRVAFFIVRKDAMLGWAARGFDGAKDADMRSLSIGIGEDAILGAAYRSAAPVLGSEERFPGDRGFLSRLGAAPPAEAMAVPILLRDKIAAILYGDSGAEERITDPELPQVLALHAGLCLETLAARQKYPRPPASASASRSGAAQASNPGTASVAPPSPPPAMPDSSSLTGIFQRPSGLTPSGGIPAVRPSSHAPAGGMPAVRPSSLTPSGGIPAVRPSVPVSRPAPPEAEELVEAVEEAAPVSDADRKLHEEARRFARLLVSEMVLYNEKQVEEGRRNKDIYERLRDDIDRSHQMYEQRISQQVRASSNYFYEEMVRTLANGDRSAIKVPWA